MKEPQFAFKRARGLIWVCDMQGSTKLLNNNDSAEFIENYIPRLHWMAHVFVQAAGGIFIKWTGDGFLAWFPIDLHRSLGTKASTLMEALWHLTIINNLTNFSLTSPHRIRLKHGVTYEQDALITEILDENGKHVDVTGRSVVLAFRSCSVEAKFPCIVTEKQIAAALKGGSGPKINFKPLKLTREEKMKYYKNEKWGTSDLVVSVDRQPRPRSTTSVVGTIKKTIALAESSPTDSEHVRDFISEMHDAMMSGPPWARQSLTKSMNFFHKEVLTILKNAVTEIEKADSII